MPVLFDAFSIDRSLVVFGSNIKTVCPSRVQPGVDAVDERWSKVMKMKMAGEFLGTILP